MMGHMCVDPSDFSSLIDFARKYHFTEITHGRVSKDGVWCVKDNTYLVAGDDTPNQVYFFTSTIEYILDAKYASAYRSQSGIYGAWYVVLGTSVREAMIGVNIMVMVNDAATLGENSGALGWFVAAEYDL